MTHAKLSVRYEYFCDNFNIHITHSNILRPVGVRALDFVTLRYLIKI